MTSIAILGPGGVGGFLAAALARSGEDVTVVARERTAQQLAETGITLRSAVLGEFVQPVSAVSRLTDAPDVLIVAVKAVGLDGALARVEGRPALVVPLLNGLEHMPLLRTRFGEDRVAAGTIRIESDRPEPGVVVQASPGTRIDLAADRDAPAKRLPALAETFRHAGIPTRVAGSEAEVLWSKLVRLVALATTTAAADRPLGEIRDDPAWRERLHGVVAEAAAVANAEGVAADPAATNAELDEAHASLGSSMQRDIAAGRPPELDAIAGAVLRAGHRHRIACPTLSELARQIAARAGIDPPSA